MRSAAEFTDIEKEATTQFLCGLVEGHAGDQTLGYLLQNPPPVLCIAVPTEDMIATIRLFALSPSTIQMWPCRKHYLVKFQPKVKSNC